MSKGYINLAVKPETYKKLKQIKEVHGLTFDELINKLLESLGMTQEVPK